MVFFLGCSGFLSPATEELSAPEISSMDKATISIPNSRIVFEISVFIITLAR
jgi:hypothetical protein